MESGDTEKKPNRTESINTVMQNTAHRFYILRVLEYMHKIKMAYNREEVLWAWLLVVLSKVKGTALAKKKPICAEIKINTWVMPVYWKEEKEKEDGEIGVLAVCHCSSVFYHLWECYV